MKTTAKYLINFIIWTMSIQYISAKPQDTLRDPVSTIHFEFDGRILIPVKLNGKTEMKLILDTGFPQENLLLLMHKELGDDLNLDYVQSVNAARGAGSGEAKLIHLAVDNEISVAQVNIKGMTIGVMDDNMKTSSHHNKGVLGGALFIPYIVKIDFDNQVLDLYEPGSFIPGEGWVEIQLDLSGRQLPVIETSFSFDSSQLITGRFIIDIGAQGNMVLVLDEKSKSGFPGKTIHTLSGTGLRGDVFSDMGRVAELKLGNYRLDNLISALVPENDMAETSPIFADINCQGLIGIETLSQFNLVFDYTRGKMFIRPNKNFGLPFEVNMAGMVIRERTGEKFYVYHVMVDGEAYSKGLRKGDILQKINGIAVSELTYYELKSSFEKAGKSVRLQIIGNNEIKNVRLQLARII